jgi:hypothetical protein
MGLRDAGVERRRVERPRDARVTRSAAARAVGPAW